MLHAHFMGVAGQRAADVPRKLGFIFYNEDAHGNAPSSTRPRLSAMLL
jgi:hypothetical protein